MPVDRVTVGEHPLRDALAHDRHELLTAPVLVGEVATGEKRDAERREETGRDVPEQGEGIFLAIGARVTLDRELEAGAEPALVAPGHDAPDGDTLHARQLLDATCHFPEEVDLLHPRSEERRVGKECRYRWGTCP